MTVVLFLLLALLAGVAAYQFAEVRRWRSATAEARQASAEAHEEKQRYQAALEASTQAARDAERERDRAAIELRLANETRDELSQRFRLLANDALQTNSQLFLDRSRDQVQHLIQPVNESLRKFEEQVQAIEKSRIGAYEGLVAQVHALARLQEQTRQSTDQLKTALRSPIQRGRWGEMQLRRVVEMAGMLEYCDFSEQKTLFGETNQRPDLIVRLPNDCQVIVDAKVSLDAYLRAAEAQDESERTRHLADHSRQVRAHLKSLSDKAYWERLPCTPEFVVAFVPLESLYGAALDSDQDLLDYSASRRVLLASPMTLIALLLTVAHGWRQQDLAENAEKIRQTGIELYGRVGSMHNHFAKLGEAIERTVTAYNSTVGSLERNVLPSVRKFKDLRPPAVPTDLESAEITDSPRKLDDSRWRALQIAGSES